MNLELPSPAKINLFLDIIGVRDDGYHRLTMVNAKVSLHDTIACSVSESPGIVLTSSGSRIPLDQSNTAYKAAMRFQEQFNRPLGVRIHIEKRIPQGAGLGGGSSNAATVLTAFNRLTGDRESLESLRRIGARIGADVPFFLYEGCCLCEGIGEQVAPLLVPKSTEEPPIHVVLCHPLEHVSTPRAYEQWDLFEQPEHASPQPLIEALEEQEWQRVPGCLFNAFEPIIFENYPGIRRAYEIFQGVSPSPPRLTGSGSNLFSLHLRKEEALQVAADLQKRGLRATVCDLVV